MCAQRSYPRVVCWSFAHWGAKARRKAPGVKVCRHPQEHRSADYKVERGTALSVKRRSGLSTYCPPGAPLQIPTGTLGAPAARRNGGAGESERCGLSAKNPGLTPQPGLPGAGNTAAGDPMFLHEDPPRKARQTGS